MHLEHSMSSVEHPRCHQQGLILTLAEYDGFHHASASNPHPSAALMYAEYDLMMVITL